MTGKILLMGAALALTPAVAHGQAAGGHGQASGQATTQSGMALGQPNQSCQDINGGNTGSSYPGNTETAPGSAFNETDGIAGSMYAGSQPQNSRNTASVSQYDVACANQPQ